MPCALLKENGVVTYVLCRLTLLVTVQCNPGRTTRTLAHVHPQAFAETSYWLSQHVTFTTATSLHIVLCDSHASLFLVTCLRGCVTTSLLCCDSHAPSFGVLWGSYVIIYSLRSKKSVVLGFRATSLT